MGFFSHIEYSVTEKRRKTSSRMILNTVSYGIVFPVKTVCCVKMMTVQLLI